jgi:hypothetical protein
MWTDRFTGHTYVRTKEVETRTGLSGPSVGLIWQLFVPKGGAPEFSCIVRYVGSEWLFIEPGQSLIFLAGGQPMPLSSQLGSSTTREVYRGGGVSEVALYPLTPVQLVSLSNAPTIEMSLQGGRGRVVRVLPEKSIASLKMFIDEIRKYDTTGTHSAK